MSPNNDEYTETIMQNFVESMKTMHQLATRLAEEVNRLHAENTELKREVKNWQESV